MWRREGRRRCQQPPFAATSRPSRWMRRLNATLRPFVAAPFEAAPFWRTVSLLGGQLVDESRPGDPLDPRSRAFPMSHALVLRFLGHWGWGIFLDCWKCCWLQVCLKWPLESALNNIPTQQARPRPQLRPRLETRLPLSRRREARRYCTKSGSSSPQQSSNKSSPKLCRRSNMAHIHSAFPVQDQVSTAHLHNPLRALFPALYRSFESGGRSGGRAGASAEDQSESLEQP